MSERLASSDRLASRVLLVGWDAADWKVITPLMEAGLMPNLERMINEGAMGNLATLEPILSPMLWNSIATGMRPYKHGILGFLEPDPATGGVRPSTSTSRRVKAIWNILTQQGLKTNVVGWFAGHPAEPINGVCVSDQYHRAVAAYDKPWPMARGCVFPETLNKPLAKLRVHPAELSAGHLLPFVPRAAEIDQVKDKRLWSVAKLLAECSTTHAAATFVMETEPWDFMAVYYDAIDHFGHGFMYYHPPRMEHVPERDFEIYKEVVNGAYRFQDMTLGRLLDLAGLDTTVILCSDHGFHSDHLRPKGTPKQPAGPAVQHRPVGILCMKGPHIKRDERIYGATLLDITPTVLTLFGLPVGDDMDGRPILQAFDRQVRVERIASWGSVPGECGMHPPHRREDPMEAHEALKQLVALGYIEEPDADKTKAAANAIRESKYNLARAYHDGRQLDTAIRLMEELIAAYPDDQRFWHSLAQFYFEARRLTDARQLIDRIVAVAGKETTAHTQLLQGSLAFAEQRDDEALSCLTQAEQANPRMPGLHIQIGFTYARMKRWTDAERSFRKALDIDSDSAKAHDGLAEALLKLDRVEEAAEEALIAVGLLHHFPMAHYHLGVALTRLGIVDRAVQALETSLAMRPNYPPAHKVLAQIHRKVTRDLVKAALHERQAEELLAAKQASRGFSGDDAAEKSANK